MVNDDTNCILRIDPNHQQSLKMITVIVKGVDTTLNTCGGCHCSILYYIELMPGAEQVTARTLTATLSENSLISLPPTCGQQTLQCCLGKLRTNWSKFSGHNDSLHTNQVLENYNLSFFDTIYSREGKGVAWQ